MNDYPDLPLTRHGHQGLLGRILGLLDTFSPYDATYVALAERLGAQLLTADEPLAAATRTHTTIGVLPGRRVCSIPSRQPPDGHGRVMDRLRGTSPKILSLSYLGC